MSLSPALGGCDWMMAAAQSMTTNVNAHLRYPGLKSFPQKALADKQHKNGMHGGMLSFEVRGGTSAGRKLMDTVQRPWSLCENLGATESIITCPAVCAGAPSHCSRNDVYSAPHGSRRS